MSSMRFRLALGADMLTVTTLVPETSRATMAPWKKAVAYLQGNQTTYQPVQVKVFVRQEDPQANSLATWLAQALQYIRGTLASAAQPGHLEVTLGASHAWVGVVDVPDDSQGRLVEEDRRAFIDAWVLSQWNQDPTHGIVRTQRVGHTHRYLVSYIPQSLLATLQALCDAEGLLLVSCHPQLIDQLADWANDLRPENTCSIAAAIERGASGSHHPLTQFVVFDPLGLRSVLRFWLPEGQRHSSASVHDFLQPVQMRLSAQLALAQPAPFRVGMWPELPADVETV